jgi:hypothetical protein
MKWDEPAFTQKGMLTESSQPINGYMCFRKSQAQTVEQSRMKKYLVT